MALAAQVLPERQATPPGGAVNSCTPALPGGPGPGTPGVAQLAPRTSLFLSESRGLFSLREFRARGIRAGCDLQGKPLLRPIAIRHSEANTFYKTMLYYVIDSFGRCIFEVKTHAKSLLSVIDCY